MTYGQIYEQVWGDYMQDIENNTIGYHICNLKEKLFAASPCSQFAKYPELRERLQSLLEQGEKITLKQWKAEIYLLQTELCQYQ